MAYQPGSGGARLVQVRTVDPGWPYYGTMTTTPAKIWTGLQDGGAIVDPSLLTAIGARVGDTLGLGEGRFRILGTVINVPGDIGLQMAFGARVFISTKSLPGTKLLAFGSRAQYETFIQLPSSINAQAVAQANSGVLRAERITVHTIADDRDNLTRGLIRLGNYLGLVALAALLLGGLGVASAVHVFIRQQLDTIAVLRCLGATSWQIFAVYLLLSLAMGLLGSLLGALLGVGLQQFMPHVVHDFLPVDVRVLPSPHAILIGIGSGALDCQRLCPPAASRCTHGGPAGHAPSRHGSGPDPMESTAHRRRSRSSRECDRSRHPAGRLAAARRGIRSGLRGRPARPVAHVERPGLDRQAVDAGGVAISAAAGPRQSSSPSQPDRHRGARSRLWRIHSGNPVHGAAELAPHHQARGCHGAAKRRPLRHPARTAHGDRLGAGSRATPTIRLYADRADAHPRAERSAHRRPDRQGHAPVADEERAIPADLLHGRSGASSGRRSGASAGPPSA